MKTLILSVCLLMVIYFTVEQIYIKQWDNINFPEKYQHSTFRIYDNSDLEFIEVYHCLDENLYYVTSNDDILIKTTSYQIIKSTEGILIKFGLKKESSTAKKTFTFYKSPDLTFPMQKLFEEEK